MFVIDIIEINFLHTVAIVGWNGQGSANILSTNISESTGKDIPTLLHWAVLFEGMLATENFDSHDEHWFILT